MRYQVCQHDILAAPGRDIAIQQIIHHRAATIGFRVLSAAAAGLMLCGLSACGTVNEKLGAGMADYVPHWAGGLPADAPPRPGTPQYDAYMKEQERLRSMPAAERAKLEAAKTGQTGDQPATAAPAH